MLEPGGSDGERDSRFGSGETTSTGGRVGAAPPLSREEELHFAQLLQSSREAFVAELSRLPRAILAELLDGAPRGPRSGSRWPLRRIDLCCERLAELDDPGEPALAETFRRLRAHKIRIDRARNALIVSNLALVTHVARQFDARSVGFADLFQEGTIGLITAVERFEWERGHKFSTYAYWWIRNSISKAIANQAALIRLPLHVRARLRRYHRVREELRSQLGRRPTAREVARRLGLTVHQLSQLVGVTREPQPLENHGSEEDGAGPLGQVADENSPSPLDTTLDRELHTRLSEALDALNPREREVLERRFGMNGRSTQTLEELGHVFKLSRERVRQIERRGLAKVNSAPGIRELSPRPGDQPA